MIFITLGSQKFNFNRLLMEVDRLITNGIIEDHVFAQIGYSDYQPTNFKYKNFLDRVEFTSYINHADLIITHGGTGVIVNSIKLNKKVIAVARRREFNEHVDDHQIDIVRQFNESNYIVGIEDVYELEMAIKKINGKQLGQYKSNTDNVIRIIEEFIHSMKGKDT